MLSKESLYVLDSCGWKDKGNVPKNEYIEFFNNNNVKVSKEILEFLDRFGGNKYKYTTKHGNVKEFYFDPIKAIGNWDIKEGIQNMKDEYGIYLVPIGEFDNENISSYMSLDGKVYGEYGGEPELFANTGEEFINFLCKGVKIK